MTSFKVNKKQRLKDREKFDTSKLKPKGNHNVQSLIDQCRPYYVKVSRSGEM